MVVEAATAAVSVVVDGIVSVVRSRISTDRGVVVDICEQG